MLNLIAERKRPLLLLARRINVIGANPFVQVVVVVVVLVLVLVGRGEVVLRKKERTPEVPSRNHGSWSSGSFELSTAVLIRGWSRVFGEESRSAWELGSGWLAGWLAALGHFRSKRSSCMGSGGSTLTRGSTTHVEMDFE